MKIYIAGPQVFKSNAVALGKFLKDKCSEYGHEGLFPFDNECDTSEDIFQANFDMIKSCDVVIACIEPFRGPSADVGTAWEIGAAKALGKIVIGYKDAFLEEYKHRAEGCTEYPAVEDFGLTDNLMIAHGCDRICRTFDKSLEWLNRNSW